MSLQERKSGSAVLVIGAGLTGMTAAHHLVEWGAHVHLADPTPHLGGAFLLLDHTFTTNSCGLCIALPRQPSYCPTISSELDPRITLLPGTTLAALEGKSGEFAARLCHAPRYVDPSLCDNCGACAAACPVPRPRSRWGRSLHEHPQQVAIYPPPPRAVPFVYAIDPEVCTHCGTCVDVCPRRAIDLGATSTETLVEVDAVVLSPGFAPFDATRAVEYGWGRYTNVVTHLEFESMLNLSGPTGGRPLRPSDRQPPRRIAFIHCVGSRSEKLGRPYCSTSCCMIAAKQVAMTREVVPETAVTVFTMDVRAAGKGYERYFQRVAALPGVTYRWGLPAMVHETLEGDGVRLLTPDGEQVYDLVVLAVGTGPSDEMRELSARAGVALDDHGFVLPGDDGPGSTSRPGVFAAGSALAPADVPEAVTQAAAVAALAAETLPPLSSRLQTSDGTRDTGADGRLDRPPRIGLFLCTCRGTLEGTLDFGTLSAEGKRLRAVAHVECLEAACEVSGHSAIERAVAEQGLNRIVVAGCLPRLYSAGLEALMDRLGLPARLLARVDIREGAAWAHAGDPAATDVAQSQLAMAIAGLRETPYSAFSVHTQEDPAGRVLVLGGGLAGMTAALTLNALGVACDLVEREVQLGGNLRESTRTLEGLDAQALLTKTVTRVQQVEKVRVWTEAELANLSGVRGDFAAQVRIGSEVHRERYGAIVVATGARQVRPNEYLYGQHERVVTQRELEAILAADKRQGAEGSIPPPASLKSVVMIQCVGSRNDEHPYCSRICCAQAIKNALALKELDPAIEVSILFRDMRTMGTHELAYLEARRQGVIPIRYDEDNKPVVSVSAGSNSGWGQPGTRLHVAVWDEALGQEVSLYPDLLVLSAGIESRPANEALARLIGVSLDEDGFLAEAHPKLRPTDLARPGVYLCGMAYGPRFVEESITQARAAALRAALTVARPPETRRDIAAVVPKLCSSCGLCVIHCPYGARVLDQEEVARVIDHLCQGCGVCVVVCPNGASRQPALEPVRLLAIVDAALAE